MLRGGLIGNHGEDYFIVYFSRMAKNLIKKMPFK